MAPVQSWPQELREQVDVCAATSTPSNPGAPGVRRRRPVILDDLPDLVDAQLPRRLRPLPPTGQVHRLFRVDRGRPRGPRTEELRVRHRAGVPQLQHDPPAERVQDVRDLPPPRDLLAGVHTGTFRNPMARSLTQVPSVMTSPAPARRA
jgi:hypothetical protein